MLLLGQLMGADWLKVVNAVHISFRAGPDQRSFEQIEHLGMALDAATAKRQGLQKFTYLSGMLVCSGLTYHLPRFDECDWSRNW